MRTRPPGLGRLVLCTALALLLAAVSVGWLAGVALGIPEGTGWALFALCLGLLLTLTTVVRTVPPFPVPAYTYPVGASFAVGTVVVAALAAATLGLATHRPRLVQAGISAIFVLAGVGGAAGCVRSVRLRRRPTRRPGGAGPPRAR